MIGSHDPGVKQPNFSALTSPTHETSSVVMPQYCNNTLPFVDAPNAATVLPLPFASEINFNKLFFVCLTRSSNSAKGFNVSKPIAVSASKIS